MPIQKISGGFKFGKHGKLYKGKDAKEKAKKQGAAIHISQSKQVKMSSRAKGYERSV